MAEKYIKNLSEHARLLGTSVQFISLHGMKVSEYIFSSDIFLGSTIAGGTSGRVGKQSLWFTDGHACMF